MVCTAPKPFTTTIYWKFSFSPVFVLPFVASQNILECKRSQWLLSNAWMKQFSKFKYHMVLMTFSEMFSKKIRIFESSSFLFFILTSSNLVSISVCVPNFLLIQIFIFPVGYVSWLMLLWLRQFVFYLFSILASISNFFLFHVDRGPIDYRMRPKWGNEKLSINQFFLVFKISVWMASILLFRKNSFFLILSSIRAYYSLYSSTLVSLITSPIVFLRKCILCIFCFSWKLSVLTTFENSSLNKINGFMSFVTFFLL